MKHGVAEQILFQYITDSDGQKTAVILEIGLFKKLIEELEDAHLGALAESIFSGDANEDEERHTLEQIERDLLGKS